MSASPPTSIRLRGVRQNNLKAINLDLPLRQLIVIAGLSGSGKSSLAFETLFAEGQRRYIETFSPYARQFLDRMDKPQADSVIGIPPAIAIEQRNTVKSTRSTVGTMTEITDYAKLFWPHLARLQCRQCGQPVQKESPQIIWTTMREVAPGGEALITFNLALSEKFSFEESLALISRQGYQRLSLDGEVLALEEAAKRIKAKKPAFVTVVQDRVKLTDANRPRFVEACEQAYHFGKGKLAIQILPDAGPPALFSNRLHCAKCDLEYSEPTPALFSFNHPIGACAACRGFGRIIAINYDAAIPDRCKTLAGGAVKPWQTPSNAECQEELLKFARLRKIPVDVPFRDLSKNWQDWVIDGDPDYNKDKAHTWPHAWYGVKGYFRWLESRAYKMHVRVQLARYRIYEICPTCHGTRFGPDTLLYRVGGLTLADFYRMPVGQALQFIDSLATKTPRPKTSDPMTVALAEVRSRLAFLDEVGLNYLTLDRQTRSLSGGETERVNLTACLGSRLVNTLFILDEPSVGLHPRDTARLVRILRQLRDAGNTVAVVEHEASVIRAADQIVELGPGRGEAGGAVVFQGSFKEILRDTKSLTGAYLSGRMKIEVPPRRPVSLGRKGKLRLRGATLHNLKNLAVEIPLGRFVCVTGVSGSGKTTLIRDVLTPALVEKLSLETTLAAPLEDEESEDAPVAETNQSDLQLEGWEGLGQIVIVDQSPLGRTPRSNPAVYTGAFEEIRAFYAQTEAAQQRGLGPSAFSFNSGQGQCERCRGAGFEKIEMQFLSDIFIRCPECNGRRYRPHILEVTIPHPGATGRAAWSIADLLEATVDEVIQFLRGFPESKPAQRAAENLSLLQELGLGYLRLGQPINTLSGGESQRLKLVKHLAHARESAAIAATPEKPAIFLFDEPTTGLHFDDVRILLKVFQRLADAGHTVLVIEHNLDVIKSADWIIDLGPEAGDEGGKIVAEGTPETIATIAASHTGRALTTNAEL